MDNRRKIIVINKGFQHQYAAMVVALVVVCTNLFIIARAWLPVESPLELTLGTTLVIGAVELVLIYAVWRLSILATHRIAGPVYVFTRQVKALGAGDLTGRIHLRDKDHFKAEAAEMNAALDALQEKVGVAKRLAAELQKAQDEGVDTRALVAELAGALDTLQTSRED